MSNQHPIRAVDSLPELVQRMRDTARRIEEEAFTDSDADPSWRVAEALSDAATDIEYAVSKMRERQIKDNNPSVD